MTDRTMYNVAKLAEHWDVSTTFVYDLLNGGTLKGFKLGGKLWRISSEAVQSYEKRDDVARDAALALGTTLVGPVLTRNNRAAIARDMRLVRLAT